VRVILSHDIIKMTSFMTIFLLTNQPSFLMIFLFNVNPNTIRSRSRYPDSPVNGDPLPFPLSGQRGVWITNIVYSVLVIRTVRITGNGVCPDNGSPG